MGGEGEIEIELRVGGRVGGGFLMSERINPDQGTLTGRDSVQLTSSLRYLVCNKGKLYLQSGNTKGGSITVPLTSCLTDLD
jgi:hypothetical protein